MADTKVIIRLTQSSWAGSGTELGNIFQSCQHFCIRGWQIWFLTKLNNTVHLVKMASCLISSTLTDTNLALIEVLLTLSFYVFMDAPCGHTKT